MLIKISVMFVVVNLIYELFEIVFPMSKMAEFVKGFVSVIFLYIICMKLIEMM